MYSHHLGQRRHDQRRVLYPLTLRQVGAGQLSARLCRAFLVPCLSAKQHIFAYTDCVRCFRVFRRAELERYCCSMVTSCVMCLKRVSAFAISASLFVLVGSRQSTPRQVRRSPHANRNLCVQVCSNMFAKFHHHG